MQAFRRRGTAIAILAAATTACGHSGSSDTSGAPQDAADASAADDVATRACTPATAPASVWLEAVTPDGHYLVGTTEAATAATPGASHLFYGTPEHMAEAHVAPEQEVIGCAAFQSTFVVDGVSYQAVVASPSCGNSIGSRISTGAGPSGAPRVLTVLILGGMPADAGAAASALPDGFTYFCL
jgi:hypothetical protein